MMLAANPFIRLYKAPVETLTLAAYACGLLALLGLTWWALYGNILTLTIQFKKRTWTYDPPPSWVFRLIAVPLVFAIDAAALAAFIHLTT